MTLVEQEKQQIDCLILQDSPELLPVVNWLHEQGTLLPLVLVKPTVEAKKARSSFQDTSRSRTSTDASPDKGKRVSSRPRSKTKPPETPAPTSGDSDSDNAAIFYHTAVVQVSSEQLEQIPHYIDQAIAQFLELSSEAFPSDPSSIFNVITERTAHNFLSQQQRRLAEKLRERLGYLGVYYKRNSQHFFRHFSSVRKQEFLEELKSEYRVIVLSYFTQENSLNQKIDELVNKAFFSDIPVTHLVEIHMELMDEFSKQLKLEGRSEEILLDYRLTLIDVIAHLCEMYRRSIPRDS